MGKLKIQGNVELTDTLVSTSTLYLDRASGHSILFSSNGVEQGRFTPTGNFTLAQTNTGFWLKDSAGNDYPGVYDNGSNLWIGSKQTSDTHHTGNLYLSAGYNGTSGNTTAYICVPNATNTNGSSYGILHAGNLSWTAGTTAGPQLTVDVNGTAKKIAAIPAASATASGIITTDAQNIAGNKTFKSTVILNNAEAHPAIYWQPSNVGALTASIQNALNLTDGKITNNQLQLVQWSYTSGSTTRLNKYEIFSLPPVTPDRTTNQTYYILTTKPSTSTYTMASLRLTNNQDANVSADNETALIIGSRSGTHLTIDNNEIIAKKNGTTGGPLYLNSDGGIVNIGTGGLSVDGNIIANNSSLGGSIHFLSTRSTDYKPTGVINYYASESSSSTDYDLGAFYFTQYSYTDGTYKRIDHWDRYMLPPVAAGKTSDHTYSILTSKNAVTIAQGGTGATTRVGAVNSLFYLGGNLVSTKDQDIPSVWKAYGQGFAYFNEDVPNNEDTGVKRPATWMHILNIGPSGHALRTQLGFNARDSDVYVRGGSSSSGDTFGAWYTVLTTKSTVTVAQGGTGATTFTSGYLIQGNGTSALKVTNAHINYTAGTTSADGFEELVLGNSTKSGTAGNTYGRLALYSTSSAGIYLTAAATTAWSYTNILPAVSGTLLNTGNYSTYALPLSGGTMTGTISSQHITPKTTNAYNLGAAAAPWYQIVTRRLYLFDGTNDDVNYGRFMITTQGTTSAQGVASLYVGNANAAKTAGGSYGQVIIYGEGAGYAVIRATASATAKSEHYLPTTGGTLLNTATYSSYALPLAGGNMTGAINITTANMYYSLSDHTGGAIRLNNGDIGGVNAMWFKDACGVGEGLHFYVSSTTVDTVRANNGVLYFDKTYDTTTSKAAASYTVLHSGNYTTYAPKKDGTGASGTWGISITGNAATATTANTASAVAWGNVSGKPSSYTPAGHTNHATLKITSTATTQHLTFSRVGANYIDCPDGGGFYFSTTNGTSASASQFIITKTAITLKGSIIMPNSYGSATTMNNIASPTTGQVFFVTS